MILITLKSGKQVVVQGDSPFALKETITKGLLTLMNADGTGYWPEANCVQDWAFLPQAKYDEAMEKQKEADEKRLAQIAHAEEQQKRRDEQQEQDRAAAEAQRKRDLEARAEAAADMARERAKRLRKPLPWLLTKLGFYVR
jgi:regulator of protease activity HflC (stomatin/prohibitin superfamily)